MGSFISKYIVVKPEILQIMYRLALAQCLLLIKSNKQIVWQTLLSLLPMPAFQIQHIWRIYRVQPIYYPCTYNFIRLQQYYDYNVLLINLSSGLLIRY